MAKKVKKVAFLTAGGLAPCLSSSIGFLIDEYTRKAPDVKLIGYLDGYMGLLKGNSVADAGLIIASIDPCFSCMDR